MVEWLPILVFSALSVVLGIAIGAQWINEPVVLIEYRNQTCPAEFQGLGNNWVKNDEKYCYTVPSEPKCTEIHLKNGSIIRESLCFQNFNYVIKCIDRSEIAEIEYTKEDLGVTK